ncbi:hypothetical protein OUZ56_002320 [Daphnia magna]|uniref:Uncharacterized protein n=1 Tax=Daphnia magna TaxID=35525 RepID=A0ABR0A5A6_9CRUS|nr:hypothetical protein OUZ56_002320 [Daphnia magna]
MIKQETIHCDGSIKKKDTKLFERRLAISTIKYDDRIAIPSDQQGHLRALQTAKIHLSIKLELNNASRSLFDPVK